MNKRFFWVIVLTLLCSGCKNKSKPYYTSNNTRDTDNVYVEQRTIETQDDDYDVNSSNDEISSVNEETQFPVVSFEGDGISEEEANPFSWCSNFEPSDRDVPGQIVYEGSNDYYIIEDNYGYIIAESYSGWPSEGDKVYGDLNSFGFKWVVNTQNISFG